MKPYIVSEKTFYEQRLVHNHPLNWDEENLREEFGGDKMGEGIVNITASPGVTAEDIVEEIRVTAEKLYRHPAIEYPLPLKTMTVDDKIGFISLSYKGFLNAMNSQELPSEGNKFFSATAKVRLLAIKAVWLRDYRDSGKSIHFAMEGGSNCWGTLSIDRVTTTELMVLESGLLRHLRIVP